MILNKAGSVRHSDEVVTALEATGIPVLGVLPRDAGIEAPSRHLGLVPVAERPDATAALDRLAGQIADPRRPDPGAVDRLLRAPARRRPPGTRRGCPVSAPRTPSTDRPTGGGGGRRTRLHLPVRRDRPSCCPRPGCDPVIFDPAHRRGAAGRNGRDLPGWWVPRGARPRAGRQRHHDRRRCGRRSRRACRRWPSAPDCCTCAARVDGVPMVGAIDADAAMSPKLTLGYRTAVADHDHLLGADRPPGDRARVPPDHGDAERRRRAGVAARRGRRRLLAGPGRHRRPDAARVLPAHPLGRAPDAGGPLRRRRPRVRQPRTDRDFWSSSTN